MANITITFDGVLLLHLLQNLKTHKACGPDGIPIHLLKETTEEVAPILLVSFRASLKQEKNPRVEACSCYSCFQER